MWAAFVSFAASPVEMNLPWQTVPLACAAR
jgi:hypothetical protein